MMFEGPRATLLRVLKALSALTMIANMSGGRHVGHFRGYPKMAYFGRNLAIKSLEMVKTIRNRVQNDGQSEPDNF